MNIETSWFKYFTTDFHIQDHEIFIHIYMQKRTLISYSKNLCVNVNVNVCVVCWQVIQELGGRVGGINIFVIDYIQLLTSFSLIVAVFVFGIMWPNLTNHRNNPVRHRFFLREEIILGLGCLHIDFYQWHNWFIDKG